MDISTERDNTTNRDDTNQMLQPLLLQTDPFLARPRAVAYLTMTTRSILPCTRPLIPISLDRKEAMSSLRRMPRCRHCHSGSVLEDTPTSMIPVLSRPADSLAVDPEISSREATGCP